MWGQVWSSQQNPNCWWHYSWLLQSHFFLDNRVKPNLTLLSFNMNGTTSKIEDSVCINLFQQYDIVCLSELKTSYPFSVSGFMCVSAVILGEELPLPPTFLREKNNWVPHMDNKQILIYIQYQCKKFILLSLIKPYQLLITCDTRRWHYIPWANSSFIAQSRGMVNYSS